MKGFFINIKGKSSSTIIDFDKVIENFYFTYSTEGYWNIMAN